MKSCIWQSLALGAALMGSAAASYAQVVGVTLRYDTNQIVVGGSTLLHVEAQILPAYRSSTEQIFSWYVDVLNTNGAAATANYAAMLKTASDRDPQTSSLGTADGANRRGIYDTFMNLAGAGRDSVIELITLSVQGVAPGQTRFAVQAGTGGAALSDFVVATTGGGEPLFGGDYSLAAANLTVLPNPLVAPRLTISRGPAAGQVTIRYAVQAGFDYYVEYRDSLATGVLWQTLPGGPHNTGAPTDIPGVRARFYRVRAAAH
jgi:hypothetical protein